MANQQRRNLGYKRYLEDDSEIPRRSKTRYRNYDIENNVGFVEAEPHEHQTQTEDEINVGVVLQFHQMQASSENDLDVSDNMDVEEYININNQAINENLTTSEEEVTHDEGNAQLSDVEISDEENEQVPENENLTTSEEEVTHDEGNAQLSDVEISDEENEQVTEDEHGLERVCHQDNDQLSNEEFEDEHVAERQNGMQMPNGNKLISSADSNLTQMDSLLAVLSFAIKHHISSLAISDVMELINLHCPNTLPASQYLLRNTLTDYRGTCEFHIYCVACHEYMGELSGVPESCHSCGSEVNAMQSIKDEKFFMYLPLSQQYKHLLENTDVGKTLLERRMPTGENAEVISDITDGNLYRKLVRGGMLNNPEDFSLLFNTDGVPIFKSSQRSIWPLLCSINEIPAKNRKENIILAGLWFGGKKPEMKTFLKPFIDESNDLSLNGLTWSYQGSQKISKIFSLLCSVDTVARPVLQNMIQFNGFYGCGYCKQRGEYCEGAVRYPFDNSVAERTELETKRQSIHAEESGRTIQGIKGVSPLAFLLHFNLILNFIPDYMHSVCLGTVRRFVGVWLKTANRRREFYVGNRKAEIDQRMRQVQCTKEMTRLPRSLADIKFWKASEWRSFLYFSPVILQGILPVKYLAHWLLLASSMLVLNSNSITLRSINECRFKLQKFIIYIDTLYGKKEATFNNHLLLHIVDSVRNWGPVWSTSAFNFESYNGYLKKLFAGTRYLPQQIFQTLCCIQDLQANVTNITAEEAAEYIHNMMMGQRLLKSVQRGYTHFEKIICLGIGKPIILNEEYKQAIMVHIRREIVFEQVYHYNRFIFRNILFTCRSYSNRFRRRDSIIDTGTMLGEIIHLVTFKNHECGGAENCRCLQHYIILMQHLYVISSLAVYDEHDAELGATSQFFKKIRRGEIVAIDCNIISSKGILIEINNSEYIITLPNLVEGD